MNKYYQKSENNLPQQLKGNEEIIKNLSTLPENSSDREDLLNQIAPEGFIQSNEQRISKPAQDEKGSHAAK